VEGYGPWDGGLSVTFRAGRKLEGKATVDREGEAV
jgi:hypothetical protein